MVARQVYAWARQWGGEARNEVARFEQNMGSTVGEGVLECVNHQSIAVDTQPFECDVSAPHTTAKALEYVALMALRIPALHSVRSRRARRSTLWTIRMHLTPHGDSSVRALQVP